VGWFLFCLFCLASLLQTIREAARAIIDAIHENAESLFAAIGASPGATAAAMRRAVRRAAAKEAV